MHSSPNTLSAHTMQWTPEALSYQELPYFIHKLCVFGIVFPVFRSLSTLLTHAVHYVTEHSNFCLTNSMVLITRVVFMLILEPALAKAHLETKYSENDPSNTFFMHRKNKVFHISTSEKPSGVQSDASWNLVTTLKSKWNSKIRQFINFYPNFSHWNSWSLGFIMGEDTKENDFLNQVTTGEGW